jgi:hypothetical protein
MLLDNPFVSNDRVLVVETAAEYTAICLRHWRYIAGSPLVLRARELSEDAVKGKDVISINIAYNSIPESIKDSAKSFQCVALKF